MSWAAAAGAAGAVGSALIGKSGSKSSTQDPKWLAGAKQDLVRRGSELSNRPYESFGGDRVAGISENEQSAFDLASRQSDEARGYMSKAGEQLDRATEMDYQRDVTGYMNPYIESVLQPQLREQNRQYERASTALTNSKGGAWGGDRSAFAQSELERTHRENIADVTGRTYSEAFDAASRNFFNDAARRESAAGAYQRLGEGVQNLDTQDIQNLMATGGVERLLRQAGLDANYEAFLERRDWDVNNLDTLMRSIQAAGGNTTTTRTDSSGRSGAVGQILGAGTALAGMYFTGRVSKSERQQIGANASAMNDELLASLNAGS